MTLQYQVLCVCVCVCVCVHVRVTVRARRSLMCELVVMLVGVLSTDTPSDRLVHCACSRHVYHEAALSFFGSSCQSWRYTSIDPSIHRSIHRSIHPSIHPSMRTSICLFPMAMFLSEHVNGIIYILFIRYSLTIPNPRHAINIHPSPPPATTKTFKLRRIIN